MRRRRSLRHQVIDREVPHEPGVYALMRTDTEPVRHIAQTDDLNRTLHAWADEVAESRYYRYFSFEREPNDYERFRRVCILHHYYLEIQAGLDDERHPEPPPGTDWACPQCDIYD